MELILNRLYQRGIRQKDSYGAAVTEPVETEGATPDGGYNRDRTHWKNVEPYVGVAPHANRLKLKPEVGDTGVLTDAGP